MIQLDQISVHLPQGYLFKDVSVQIKTGDKIGLVGKNGAGKSTMLKLIAGWDKPTEGAVHKPKDGTVGFLTQDIELNTEQSVFDYLVNSNKPLKAIKDRIDEINNELVTREDFESEGYLALLDELNELNHNFAISEGFQWEEKITGTLVGLGFKESELDRSLSTFSGGWKMRAELARILVNQPDVILLDEPTNHLDIISINWLENYLKNYSGAVIVISHDRLFLDNVTKRTLEISQGRLFDFAFAYSKYKTVRAEELERLAGAKKQQDKDIKHTEELINKFRAKKNKAAFAQSLIKKLEKTERIELEDDSVPHMKVEFPLSVQPGKWVLEMENMGKAFGENRLFKGVNITVGRGEKIALLGANGTGKSTLLKRVMDELDGEGTIAYGHNVNITYFAQDQAESLDKTLTVYETVDLTAKGEIRKSLRSVLGAFLFQGEDVNKKVSVLSGGERTRLALCQLLLSPSNFLILDEPTNHLDIQSKEVLKNALKNYEGTFVVVSHDREFLDNLTTRIWEIEDQKLRVHHYGVKEFLQRKSATEVDSPKSNKLEAPVKEQKTVNLSYEEEKELKRRKNKWNNQVKRSEDAIEKLEKEISEMEAVIADLDYSDADKAQQQLDKYTELKKSYDDQMLLWEEATEALMEID